MVCHLKCAVYATLPVFALIQFLSNIVVFEILLVNIGIFTIWKAIAGKKLKIEQNSLHVPILLF